MKKHYITENKLRGFIREAVMRMLSESYIGSSPVFNDARDRDEWWKQRALTDFPGYKYLINQHQSRYGSDFQDLYYELRAKEEQKAKDNARKERQMRKQERLQAKQERELNRQNVRKLFLHAVNYVINGEDSLMSVEQIMGDIHNEIPEDWYDGVTKIPVVLDGEDSPRWASIDGVGQGNDSSGAFISAGWGITFDDSEEGVASIRFSVYVDPKKNQIYFEVEDSDNELLNLSATSRVATKYLNGVIRRQFNNAAAKVEKYGTADIPEV